MVVIAGPKDKKIWWNLDDDNDVEENDWKLISHVTAKKTFAKT